MTSSEAHSSQEYRWLYFFIGLAVLVNFSGLFVPLMDPDAGVYASVSKQMVLRNNYWELYFQGADWLDKPHFPFWITAFFFEVFGMNTWAYKLPGILFTMLGAYYTYLFTKQFYNKAIALWAVFILLSTLHIIISNTDVRAEPFLTGLLIASIYHFANALKKNIGWHLVAACLFAGCAVMTKGVFTLIPIGGAVAGQLIITKNWKQLFHWRWLVAGILVALFITPELYSLWYQFDNHPEKIVFGKNNVSGIRFFLWDSQFGRFTNSGPIKGKGDSTFFFHTLLWAFLPWCLLMYTALANKIKSGFKKIKFEDGMPAEWYTLSASLLTLFIFSLSKFQLPYYANIIFPMLAILTANYVCKMKQVTTATIINHIVTVILILVVVLLEAFYTPAQFPIIAVILIIALVIILLLLHLKIKTNKLSLSLFRAGLACLILNLYINWCFYPDLMKYQSGDEAAFYINKNHPDVPGVRKNIYSPAFEFYLKDTMIIADANTLTTDSIAKKGIWFITEGDLKDLQKNAVPHTVLKELPEFHVTMLTKEFLDKRTREKALTRNYLVKLL